MHAVEAKRTLVKSPPEVWDRVSDLGALAECLGAFGEIRITRTQPETLVEWEGELATGSVRLESSGWGTKVVLTASVPEAVVAEPVVAEAPAAAVEPEPVAEPVAVEEPADCIEEKLEEPAALAVEPEPVAEPEPEPPSEIVATREEPRAEPARRGWFARWRERRAVKRAPETVDGRELHAMRAEVVHVDSPTDEPTAPAPEPPAATPEPAASPPSAVSAEPAPAPEPITPEPEPQLTPDDALTVLNSTLDHLGAAHHRPFSRG